MPAATKEEADKALAEVVKLRAAGKDRWHVMVLDDNKKPVRAGNIIRKSPRVFGVDIVMTDGLSSLCGLQELFIRACGIGFKRVKKNLGITHKIKVKVGLDF